VSQNNCYEAVEYPDSSSSTAFNSNYIYFHSNPSLTAATYQSDRNCYFSIANSSNERIAVVFEDIAVNAIAIEQSPDCVSDWLSLYDGAAACNALARTCNFETNIQIEGAVTHDNIAKVCGVRSVMPPIYSTTLTGLSWSFNTNSHNQMAGFRGDVYFFTPIRVSNFPTQAISNVILSSSASVQMLDYTGSDKNDERFDVVVSIATAINNDTEILLRGITYAASDASTLALGLLMLDSLMLQGVGDVTLQFSSSLFEYTYPIPITISSNVPATPAAPTVPDNGEAVTETTIPISFVMPSNNGAAITGSVTTIANLIYLVEYT